MAGVERLRVTVNGVSYEVEVEVLGDSACRAPAGGEQLAGDYRQPGSAGIAPGGYNLPVSDTPPPLAPASPGEAVFRVLAPMSGILAAIKVGIGQRVQKGEVMAILDSMKMDNDILAPGSGLVQSISARPGETVSRGTLLLTIQQEGVKPGG